MRILSPDDAEWLPQVREVLRRDDLVAVPTETVYGLAGNALSEGAVEKIFRVKGRPLIDPLIVHLASMEMLQRLTRFKEKDCLERLADAFWPGPLTLVLPRRDLVSDRVTAGLPTVAVRMPAHPVLRYLLKHLPFPLAAPSANPFGYISPTTITHVLESLGDHLSLGIDGGACSWGIESTILSLRDAKKPILLRPGPIDKSSIESVLNMEVAMATKKAPADSPQEAPGLLGRHYAPGKPLILHHDEAELARQRTGATVWLCRPASPDKRTYWLSEDGNLAEVARNLFALIRKLDGAPEIEEIHCQIPADQGLGTAIRDRLQRAAAPSVCPCHSEQGELG